MNHNRKRREAEARERRRREATLKDREAALKDGVLVDPTALAPCNSYGTRDFVERGYYLDYHFTCVGCGSEEVWTALQQKWWYEVAKGDRFSGANRCRTCRRDLRRDKGKAHPLQRYGRWLALICNDLEPALLALGWRRVVGEGQARWCGVSFLRNDVLVQFLWRAVSLRMAFLLERRDGRDAAFQTLAHVEFRPYAVSHTELQRQYDDFRAAARRELGLEEKPDP